LGNTGERGKEKDKNKGNKEGDKGRRCEENYSPLAFSGNVRMTWFNFSSFINPCLLFPILALYYLQGSLSFKSRPGDWLS
jgi:hypothetical protein